MKSDSVKKTVLKATTLIGAATFITFVLGYIRDMIMVAKFGATSSTDAWIVASTIPDLAYKFLFLGALGSVFIPTFTRYLAIDKEKEAWGLASSVINLGVIILAILTVLVIIIAPAITSILAPGFSEDIKALTTKLIKIIIPVIVITWVSGLLGGILQAYLRFSPSAISSVLSSATLVAFLLYFSDRYGIFSLAYGTIAGLILSVLIMVLIVTREKIPYRFSFDLKHPEIKNIVWLMLPLAGAELIGKGIGIVDRFFASGLSPGSITSLQIASRLSSIPVFLFATASSIAIFPFLSRYAGQNKIEDLKEILTFGIKISLLIAIPSMIGLMVLRKPIIQLLFERGSFTPQDTDITATMLLYYSLGLTAQALIPLLFKTLYTFQYTKIILRYETIYFILNIIFDYLFIKIMGAPGIALATSVIVPFMVVYILRELRKQNIDIKFSILSPFLKKIIFASVLMGLICYFVSEYLGNILDLSQLINKVYLVSGSILGGFVAYFSFLILLKTHEIQRLIQEFSKR